MKLLPLLPLLAALLLAGLASCTTTSSGGSPIIVSAVVLSNTGDVLGIARSNLSESIALGDSIVLQLQLLEATTGFPLFTVTSVLSLTDAIPAQFAVLFPDAATLGLTFEEETE